MRGLLRVGLPLGNALLFCTALATAQSVDTLHAVPWLDNAFVDAHAIRTDPAGRLYVVDRGRGALFVLDPDGSIRATLSGGAQVRFVEPVDVDPTNGLLRYVADSGTGQIVPVGQDGLFLEPLGGNREAYGGAEADRRGRDRIVPVAVAVGAHGEVYAVDVQQQQVLRWDASRRRTVVSGPAEGVLVEPQALTVWGARLYVLDRHGLALFDRFGTFIRRVAQPAGSRGVRVRQLGARLAVIAPRAIQYFDANGHWESTSVWTGLPLRDAVVVPEGLLLLTARSVYRVPR